MAKGDNGRTVVKINPDIKETLYTEVKKSCYTLKEWFLQKISSYVEDDDQLELNFSSTQSAKLSQQ